MSIRLKKVFKKYALISLSMMLVACGGSSSNNSFPPIDPGSAGGGSGSGGGTTAPPAEETFASFLSDIRQTYQLPAVGGLLMHGDQTLEFEVSGLRDATGASNVTTDDLWHMGSITKSMTATVAARLVEQELIGWHTRIADVFPEQIARAGSTYQDVTLEQLLSHTGGLLRDVDWQNYRDPNKALTQLRLEVVEDVLAMPRNNAIGSFSYSNVSFVLAGAMLEAVSGKSWEQLMQEELFEPLSMDDAGFGAPTGVDSQPSGHYLDNGRLYSIAGELPESDNPPVLGPAGTVHMSLSSLAKYAAEHMRGEIGESDYLSAQSFVRLHQEVSGSNYGLGWFLQDNGSIFHDGSNRLWFAKLGISVEAQIIAISVTNVGGDRANGATDGVINEMLSRHF